MEDKRVMKVRFVVMVIMAGCEDRVWRADTQPHHDTRLQAIGWLDTARPAADGPDRKFYIRETFYFE